jgi:glycine cleavage system H protein
VHLEIAEVGTRFIKGDGICGIESVKTAADVYAPVTGEIIQHNQNIKSDASIVNTVAETDGWVLKVYVENEKDIMELMDLKQYQKFCDDNKH